ncbi:NAD(P)/FAD-dependent oxidoreductase [Streptomyces sp. O3]
MLIVGAGATGLLTAVRCVRAGHQVTVVDRGAIPNPESTSYDQHRAVRSLDPDDLDASRRLAGAHWRWLELEELLGSAVYRRVGALTAWPAARADEIARVAATANLPITVVGPADFPHIRFPADSVGVLEHDAGVLLADHVLWAVTQWLVRRPEVTLRPWQEVTRVHGDAAKAVLADGEVIGGDLVLIATGPWSRELVDLPMVLLRQTMVYLKPPPELAKWWNDAPSAGQLGSEGRAWLLPSGGGALLKVSTHTVCRKVDGLTDRLDEDEAPFAEQIMAESVVTDAERYQVKAVKRCHYLVDADTGEAHLRRIGPAAWARTASGGDGFRTAPLVADRIVRAVEEL